jgi:hypothetical protein
MYNPEQFPSSDIELSEESHTKTKGTLSPPQREAMTQIFELNKKYPKRWFTSTGELEKVSDRTLLALIRKGYLITKQSEANPRVRYFQYTGKPFECPTKADFAKYDQSNNK